MTSSIARMNCFLHGIEDFQIVRGDTLSEPKFVQRDRLMRFDVVLANPPYSIKQWDRELFASDPWGRNLFGTPPQGRADYAFWQHILCSLATKTGRCAILFPHGVLFRQEEAEMRRKLIETDTLECVLGLGPNLFYNSPMEACVVICSTTKPKARKGRILLINAVNEVTRERAQSFLTNDHIERVVRVYEKFKDEPGFARVLTLEEIRGQGGNLNIPLYVAANEPVSVKGVANNGNATGESLVAWFNSAGEVRCQVDEVLGEKLVPSEVPHIATIAKALPSWLDRRKWKKLAFGKFADSINERVEPVDAADEIYVGLDDLDSKDLHIRRWGQGSDVIGTKLRFCKGDIIFGRRRAYQRKLAVAEIDGICSAHAMVVRAKSSIVLPEFLPFLMMSDRFMKRAVEISVGSLSPTINWSTLKLEEFDVPPLDQQQRIAEILWGVDATIERYSDLATTAKEAGDWSRHDHFTNGDRYRLTPLRQAGRWISGGTPSRNRPEFWNGSFPWVSPKDMKQPVIHDSEEHLTAAGREQLTEVGSGTLLIVIRGMILAHSFPVAIAQRNVAFNQDMKALVPSEAFSSKYLLHWFKWATPRILGRISDSSHGTKRLAMEDLFDMKVPTPKLDDQSVLIEQIEKLEMTETFALKNVEALKLFSKTFLDRLG